MENKRTEIMNKKFTIRNCPAFLGADCINYQKGDESDCANCVGCQLKDIVNECERVINNFNNGKYDKHSHEAYFGMCDMAETILSKLKIKKM